MGIVLRLIGVERRVCLVRSLAIVIAIQMPSAGLTHHVRIGCVHGW